MPDRNLDLHERMKNAKDDENVGKYKTFFLCAIKKAQYILGFITYAEVKFVTKIAQRKGKGQVEVYHSQVLILYMKCYSINLW